MDAGIVEEACRKGQDNRIIGADQFFHLRKTISNLRVNGICPLPQAMPLSIVRRKI
jgi:hypothetical protein